VSAPPPTAPRTRVFRPAETLQPWLLGAVSAVATFMLANALLSLYKQRGAWDVAWHAIAGGVVAVVVLLLYRSRIECDDAGLRFRGGAPWPLPFISPDWEAPWPEIRAARWVESVSPAILELDTARGTRRLMALQWQLDAAEARVCRRAMAAFRLGRTDSFDATLLPLVRALREHGVDVPTPIRAEDGATGFDLTRNAATVAALLLGAFAAGFWFIDANLSNQMYGRNEPWTTIALCAAAVALGFSIAQARRGVPLTVNVFVSLVVGVSVGLACYGGLQRLNQLADREGRSVEFTLSRDGTLVSNVAGVADLPPGFFGDRGFWARQKAGSTHRFGYHRGLGFETLDIREYRDRLKTFYGRDPGRDVVRP
jgi:hypothetical protein